MDLLGQTSPMDRHRLTQSPELSGAPTLRRGQVAVKATVIDHRTLGNIVAESAEVARAIGNIEEKSAAVRRNVVCKLIHDTPAVAE